MACIRDERETVGDEPTNGFNDHIDGNNNEGKQQYFLVIGGVSVVVPMIVPWL